ncbi:MAG: hypothetical protein HDR89_07695 [Bacteroides sp.]|nr:hypothetical protein [Bacteroides sp.]MBD5350744.1 hypothetical protein [Bacteroides sp.]
MNIKVLFVTLLTAILSAMSISAESQQEVTLTVSSDGPTKEDATKNALRNAIEQAFGAFVSANTTILNDEIVKDEIVTVSNGSIKEYKEISAVQTSDRKHLVTLSATVSLPNLITYAKSHGSECEFAGNTFGMEMKLFELQTQNERKILENILQQLEVLVPATMSWQMEISEPVISKDSCEIKALIKWLDVNFDEYNYRLSYINLPKEALEWSGNPYLARDNWKKYKKQYNNDWDKYCEDVYTADQISRQAGFLNEYLVFLLDNLSSISLTDADYNMWDKRGADLGTISYDGIGLRNTHDYRDKSIPWGNCCRLRSWKNAKFFYSEFKNLINRCAMNFVIKDNTGQISDPMLLSPQEIELYSNCNNVEYWERTTSPVYGRVLDLSYNFPTGKAKGTGLFKNGYEFDYYPGDDDYIRSIYKTWGSPGSPYYPNLMELTFKIPKEEIGKYSKFWIEQKK